MGEKQIDLNAFITCSEPVLGSCEKAAIAFEDKFGRPRLYQKDNGPKWVYDENKLEHVCIFRVVRIISAFRACFLLLDRGYLQEIAVLLRTIVAFQAEIVFLIEGYRTGNVSDNQKRFVTECFKEHFQDPTDPSEGVQPRDIVPRKKMHAAFARSLSPVANPTGVQKIINMEEDIFNGFVHGTAPCALEFYGFAGTTFPEFPMHGIANEKKTKTWLKQLLIYLHRFANKVSNLCENFGFPEIGHEISMARVNIERYANMEFSLSFDGPTPKILRK
jgi:hypothetical protein